MTKAFSTRLALFVTVVTNCICVALLSVALGTQSWVTSDCNNTASEEGTGRANFGVFKGHAKFDLKSTFEKTYWLVCLENLCMFSSRETEEARQESLAQILSSCSQNSSGVMTDPVSLYEERDGGIPYPNHYDYSERIGHYPTASLRAINQSNSECKETPDELMDEGLLIATVTTVCLALIFSVVGGIFGVINTALTPYQLILGVPGLYGWNLLAAVLELVSIACWGVQFSDHLKLNILIEDFEDGWTTEGFGHLGYSYWLVFLALLVHLGNCLLIFFSTRKKKSKTHYKAPDTVSGDILLY